MEEQKELSKVCYFFFINYNKKLKLVNECWLCERCFNRNDVLIRNASCKLCELRGGALVECGSIFSEGNDFVHVICALLDRGTRFLKPENRCAPFSPPPRRLLSLPTNKEIEICSTSPNILQLDNQEQQQTPNSTMLTIVSFEDSGISEATFV